MHSQMSSRPYMVSQLRLYYSRVVTHNLDNLGEVTRGKISAVQKSLMIQKVSQPIFAVPLLLLTLTSLLRSQPYLTQSCSLVHSRPVYVARSLWFTCSCCNRFIDH